jgi:predicted SAM-dependent methyltransferase
MKNQIIKNLYYATLAKLTLFNYYRKKIFFRPRPGERTVIHLGCGIHYIPLPGFINIDGNPFYRKDLWLDVTIGLPFPDQSMDAIYAHHFLEHLSEKGLRRVLEESYRVLRPRGGVRFVTPDLRKAVQAYTLSNDRFFSDWPDPRHSLGGKLNNYLLCRNQHRFMFDFEFLKEFLQGAGFREFREMGPAESLLFSPAEMQKIPEENPMNYRSLYVEAWK